MEIRFVPGGVLKIPLADGGSAYAVMLKTSPSLAFYPDTAALDDAERIDEDPLFIVPVMRKAYSVGRWGKLVNRLPRDVLPEIPLYFRQNIMNLDDCVLVDTEENLRKVSPALCAGYERDAVWSAEHIEERLMDTYADRPNANLETMRVKL